MLQLLKCKVDTERVEFFLQGDKVIGEDASQEIVGAIMFVKGRGSGTGNFDRASGKNSIVVTMLEEGSCGCHCIRK